MAQPNAWLPEGLQLGNYRIARKISSGGFSNVYLAQDAHGVAVAIKEYMPASLAQRKKGEVVPRVAAEHMRIYRIGLKSFFEEGRVLASIDHKNIVRVLDFFSANETVYMVMRYEEGRSLQEHILRSRGSDRKDVLSEGFIRRVFSEVMDGLREVHSRRLLHLDIKPANIYLRMDGTPILLDFGAARQTLQRDLSNTYPMYTPGFAAPELYNRDAELGAWTDVYGVGACMYSCMSGQPPQESPRRRDDDKISLALRSLRGPYSDELIALVEGCLRLNSLERPQTAYTVRRGLENAPERQKPTFIGRTVARAQYFKACVSQFVEKHDITWF